MHPGRGNLASGEEPNAFRIARALHKFGAPPSSLNKDSRYAYGPEHGIAPPSTFSRVAPEFQQSKSHPFEPASWLVAPDLSSPSFSAHDFLQRALFQKYDASRPSHLPVLGDSFNADAALAALDTVESGLRRQRDISKREEDQARDELRKVLHLSVKKKEQLARAADKVSTNLSTLGDPGRQAALSLSADVSTLRTTANELAMLQDTRDLVSLLTTESSELDIVRVSRLLSKAGSHFEDGSLASALREDEYVIAREEIERCKRELASCLDSWMRNAVDSGSHAVVKECATAAEELHISTSFIEAYISYVFCLDHAGHGGNPSALKSIERMDSRDLLQKLRLASWETVNSIGDMMPSILQSFNDASRALVALLHLLSERKVIPIADQAMNSILAKIETDIPLDNDDIYGFVSSNSTKNSSARDSIEMMRSLTVTENAEERVEKTDLANTKRIQDLTICAEVFKSVCKLRKDLLVQCSIPESNQSRIFQGLQSDPFISFIRKWISGYLKREQSWVDQQFGVAFYGTTRIESQVPRLAPREDSDAAAYHRYRSFYSQISSKYLQMTRKAIESAHESLSRMVVLLNSVLSIESLSLSDTMAYFQELQHCAIDPKPLSQLCQQHGNVCKTRADETHAEMAPGEKTGPSGNISAKSKHIIAEISEALREILDGLVMCYLANAETILQAASHLLPISEADARTNELWANGVSPLTAYMQAVEVLLQSNGVLSDFLLTLELADHVSQLSTRSLNSGDELRVYIPSSTRERIHRDLATGLSDLGAEAQSGVRAAVASVRARLFAVLSSPDAMHAYTSKNYDHLREYHEDRDRVPSTLGMEVEPSPIFINASTFVEQQLHAVLANVHTANREFVVSELSMITKETVLKHWCSCIGPFTITGALQLIADGRAMARIFHNHRHITCAIDCLPAVGQLYLESPDELWTCVESKSLSGLEARILIELLKKREDHNVDQVVKVCQSLGASLDEL